MKKRLLSVLAFALAVSAGAAFVLYQLIASKVKAGVAPAPPTTKVFVAARDLELGALIQEKDIRTEEYLSPPAGAITKKEDVVGRGVANPVHEDTPFFEASLAPRGAGAGFAVAGMRVDILVSGVPPSAGGDNAGSVTRTLLQNVQVLSAGQNYQKDAEGKPVLVQVVNLLVTPGQAELVNEATAQKIQLVLRNPADHDIVDTPGAASANLFRGGAVLPPRRLSSPTRTVALAPAPPPFPAPEIPAPSASPVTIEVFAGGRRSDATFPNPEPRSPAQVARQ